MWKDYSSGYIKNNRTSNLSIMIAAFISALLLSLLCGLFYNAWKYEVERIILEEGSWQSKITGAIDEEAVRSIKNFAHVKDVVISQEKAAKTTADIYFDDMKAVLADTPRIARMMGISPETIIYNYELLAMYLIRTSKDTAPRLVFPMFIMITVMASFSLIIIIHNSFAVSMNARIHQFGILSSIGATPKQIRTCLVQEAAILCAVPVFLGNLLGIVISMGILQIVNDLLGSSIPGRHQAVFGYHPMVFILTLLITVITIWISAWLPASKLSRLTPLEAIRCCHAPRGGLLIKKESPFLTLLFGVEGELAGSALKSQRKALRTASLSFMLSFMAFTIMQCFFSLSGISTRETYFERYQSVWDIMVTVRDTDLDAFEETGKIQSLTGVESAVAYQKATAKRMIAENELSEALRSLGGFSHASGDLVTPAKEGWLVNAPILIMDDYSFLAYCEQIGITPQLDGAVILNRIRDITNPDFRHPQYMPYVKGNGVTSILRRSGRENMAAEIPVLTYTAEAPVLREEYATLDYYELVHFIPVSLWKEIKEQTGGAKEDIHIRILSRGDATLEQLNVLQSDIKQSIGGKYALEFENRIQEYEANGRQIQGMKAMFGGFCVLLALIGISNMFSNTLGFVRQRKREFARYMSIGLTVKELKKMFCIEALAIAGRPILLTLPLAIMAIWYMLRASYVEMNVFLAEAPFVSITLFLLAIWGAVALSYYLAWRNVRKIDLAEVLKDDTMI